MSHARFVDPALSRKLLGRIGVLAQGLGDVRIMEVCGTHTMEIGKLGIRSLLPSNVSLLSGPGCPVCVTPAGVIDAAVELSLKPGVTLVSFGDMLRVPGTSRSLEQARGRGGAVSVVTSPLNALELARNDSAEQYVFAAVGFETTVPAVARSIVLAHERGIDNLSFLVAHRILPPALEALCADAQIGISGFLLPGHVSVVIGSEVYRAIPGLTVPAAITGFEPLDILAGIHSVLTMLHGGIVDVRNEYPRVVRPEGNRSARELIDRVFEPADAAWRGIGTIPGSGLALRRPFAGYDAEKKFGLPMAEAAMPAGCSCGAVLRGLISPSDCPLFASSCTPENPVGPCMVSSEGSCAAYYRYG